MAVSRVAVRLWRYRALAGRDRLGLGVDVGGKRGLGRGRGVGVPESFHELFGEVTVPKEEVLFEGREVVEQSEFVHEDFEETLASDLIRCVDGALQAGDVAIFESCRMYGVRELRQVRT